jgi:hypothetical protein
MQVRQFSRRDNTTKAMDKQISPQQQQSYQKKYGRRIRLLESVKKVNGRQKYRKITNSLFGIYRKKHKEVRKRKEEKTRLSKTEICVLSPTAFRARAHKIQKH